MGGRVGSITTEIIADGLIFNMDPANQASYPKTGTIVTDTINSVTGSLESDPTFTEDIAFDYDGTDDYMLVPSVSLSGNWALSFWYKNTSGGTPSGYRNWIGGGGGLTYGMTMATGKMVTYAAPNSPSWEPMSDSLIDGNWHNITAVYDSAAYTWTSYQNGQFFKSYNSGGTTIGYQNFGSSTLTRIGCRSNQSRFTYGSIGTVYAYNRILSANEVLHNYNALKGRFGL